MKIDPPSLTLSRDGVSRDPVPTALDSGPPGGRTDRPPVFVEDASRRNDGILKRSDFDYELPSERIAQAPLEQRDASRLMVLQRSSDDIQHRSFRDISDYLRPGDVLVLNATRVFPARLRGRKHSGGKVELLLLKEEGRTWQALVRGAVSPGTELTFAEEWTAQVDRELENGEWAVTFSRPNVREFLECYGEMPLPPYIKRPEKNRKDNQTYQTVYAREEGSIAAPTAGFHFSDELLDRLKMRGIQIVEIILHVGWGTFRPIRSDLIEEHRMLPEQYQVSSKAAGLLEAARKEGRRIIAVGTTAVRTLESSFDPKRETFRAGSGSANLFIYPGYRFHAVDALVTNFHLPHSTPLLLACAFYGRVGVQAMGHQGDPSTHRHADPFSLRQAYQEAIREKYRFYSYGDAMFIQ